MGILGTEGNEIRGELDLSIFQIHRVAEIDDAQVVRIGRRKREVDTPRDALIGSSIAECLALEHIGAGSNLDACDPRIERKNAQKQKQKEHTYPKPQAHARKHSMEEVQEWIRMQVPRNLLALTYLHFYG